MQVRLHDVDEFMRKHAVNLSVGGMFIAAAPESALPYAKGDSVYLQFRLDDGGMLIEGLARVAYVNAADHAEPGIGVEFVNLDEESLEFIDAAISQHLTTLKAG